MSKLEDFEDIPYEIDENYKKYFEDEQEYENFKKSCELQRKFNSIIKDFNDFNKNSITIPLEEYKDLLIIIIKGKYEELKNSKINSCNGNCKKNNINNGKHSCTDNNLIIVKQNRDYIYKIMEEYTWGKTLKNKF